MTQELPKNTIEFNRPQKYQPVKVLGSGACGMTLQVRDAEMDIDLVVKKFDPNSSLEEDSESRMELLDRFRDEARILFSINHPNIVRVFNYYDYRDSGTSYIIMELVDGLNVMDFAKENPNRADKIFEKILSGFVHLEGEGVLHRDIRPENILVTDEGEPKVIDFGFGKDIKIDSQDMEKSVSLNWWCEPPPEFSENVYDFQTEVYFLGKLFQKIIEDGSLSDFKYISVIRDMCHPDREERLCRFMDVWNRVANEQFEELSFSEDEKTTYSEFAHDLVSIFSSIRPSTEYRRDINEVIDHLESLYRDVMLEELIHAPNRLARIFVTGGFRYHARRKPEVANLKNFLSMIRGLSGEKRNIVLGNILTRLDAIDRPQDDNDDIPF